MKSFFKRHGVFLAIWTALVAASVVTKYSLEWALSDLNSEKIAELSAYKGAVSVKTSSLDLWQDARLGQSLGEGYRVATESSSDAQIRFENGNSLGLSEWTQIIIRRNMTGDYLVDVLKGAVNLSQSKAPIKKASPKKVIVIPRKKIAKVAVKPKPLIVEKAKIEPLQITDTLETRKAMPIEIPTLKAKVATLVEEKLVYFTPNQKASYAIYLDSKNLVTAALPVSFENPEEGENIFLKVSTKTRSKKIKITSQKLYQLKLASYISDLETKASLKLKVEIFSGPESEKAHDSIVFKVYNLAKLKREAVLSFGAGSLESQLREKNTEIWKITKSKDKRIYFKVLDKSILSELYAGLAIKDLRIEDNKTRPKQNFAFWKKERSRALFWGKDLKMKKVKALFDKTSDSLLLLQKENKNPSLRYIIYKNKLVPILSKLISNHEGMKDFLSENQAQILQGETKLIAKKAEGKITTEKSGEGS